MRKRILVSGAVLGAAFAAVQLIPLGARSNPPVQAGHTIEANVNLSQHVEKIFNKACRNCHSNTTEWPWYSKIAPMSWLVARDVDRARKIMNLSEWSEQAGRTPQSAIGVLTAACSEIQSGRMPLPQYVMLHPEARLSAADKTAFCSWSAQETRQLVQQIRRQRVKSSANHSTSTGTSAVSPSL
jgi:Haem-binding domain